VIFSQTAEIVAVNLHESASNNTSIKKQMPPNGANQNPNQNQNIPPAQFANDDNSSDSKNINADKANGEKKNEAIFILGAYNGKLALLSPDGESIYEIFDVYINTLPDYDKNLLLNGIKITDADELRSLIEDYSS